MIQGMRERGTRPHGQALEQERCPGVLCLPRTPSHKDHHERRGRKRKAKEDHGNDEPYHDLGLGFEDELRLRLQDDACQEIDSFSCVKRALRAPACARMPECSAGQHTAGVLSGRGKATGQDAAGRDSHHKAHHGANNNVDYWNEDGNPKDPELGLNLRTTTAQASSDAGAFPARATLAKQPPGFKGTRA